MVNPLILISNTPQSIGPSLVLFIFWSTWRYSILANIWVQPICVYYVYIYIYPIYLGDIPYTTELSYRLRWGYSIDNSGPFISIHKWGSCICNGCPYSIQKHQRWDIVKQLTTKPLSLMVGFCNFQLKKTANNKHSIDDREYSICNGLPESYSIHRNSETIQL